MTPTFHLLDEEEQELYACLALQHKIGYAGFTRLMEVYRSPKVVYETDSEELKTVHPRLTSETAESIRRGPDRRAWNKILERCIKLNARVFAPGSSGYPDPLLELNAPPPLLFMRGEWKNQDIRAASIVGTRNPTDYGRRAAYTLAQALAQADVTVVSGMAIGIDAEAHSGALENGGRTLAVIGCGLDVPYPPENQLLKELIVQGGAILSEFPPGAQPKRDHFPRRNRILSALAPVTVVVEAGSRSGALLTAAHTRSQGKALFAMPGSIFSPVSLGTHALLKRDACLATSVEDVLPAINGCRSTRLRREPAAMRIAPARTVENLPGENEPILELWRGEDICALDRLVERSCEKNLWPSANALAALMESLLQLEMRGFVQRLPGPAFRRKISRRLALSC